MMGFRRKGILLLALAALMVILTGVACSEDSMFEGHDADSDMWADGELNVSQIGMGISLQPDSRILREGQDISAGIIFTGDTKMPEIYTGYDVYVGQDLYFSKEGETLSGTIPYAVWSTCCKPGDVKMPIYIVAHTTKGNGYWKETFYLNVGITECDEHDWAFEVLEGRGKVYSPSSAAPSMHYLSGAYGRVYCRKCGMTQQTCYKAFSEEDTPESPEPHQYEGDRCGLCGDKMNISLLEEPIDLSSTEAIKLPVGGPLVKMLVEHRFQGSNAVEGHIKAEDEARLVNNFKYKMLDAGIEPIMILQCIGKLESTDDEIMKEAWLAMFADPELLEIRTTNEESSHQCQDEDGQMYVMINTKTNRGATTVFHEVGHAVDNMAGQLAHPDSELYTYYSFYSSEGSRDNYLSVKDDIDANVRKHTGNVVDSYLAALKRKPEKWRDLIAINKIENYKDGIIGYISEKIQNYSLPVDEQDNLISSEAQEENLRRKYFNSLPVPDSISEDIERMTEDILWDYRSVDDSLVSGHEKLENIEWKEAYKTMISDVYGGATNNQIADGLNHGSWYPNLADKELEKPSSIISDENGQINYWHYSETKIETTIEEGDAISLVEDFYTTEPWAEYTECKLQNYEGTDEVADAFLGSMHFSKMKTKIHEVMMEYLDEHGITDYGEGK